MDLTMPKMNIRGDPLPLISISWEITMKRIVYMLMVLAAFVGTALALDYNGVVQTYSHTGVTAGDSAIAGSYAGAKLSDDGTTITSLADMINVASGQDITATNIANSMSMDLIGNGHTQNYGYNTFATTNTALSATNMAQIQIDGSGNPKVTILKDEWIIPGLTSFNLNAAESPEDLLNDYSKQLLHDFFANGKVGVDISRGFNVPLSDSYNGVTCEYGWSGSTEAHV